jgi:DNA-binding CsgD family transcriptional regulator
MRISELTKKAAAFSGFRGKTMRHRLLFYTLILLLLLGTVLTGGIMLFGKFSAVERETEAMLNTQLSIYEHDLKIHFDQLAARGIRLSKELSSGLKEYLDKNGLHFSDLKGNADAIVEAQIRLYEPLRLGIETTDCSGAFFMLDTSAGREDSSPGQSKSGLYFKIGNLNVGRPIDMKLLQYRGSTDVGSYYGLEFHNMWALEIDAERFPDYDRILEHAMPDLNGCYHLTDAVRLPGTWENAMLMCVPIVGEDGEVYGICGFEISALFYKLFYMQPGTEPHLTGLLTKRREDVLSANAGLESGSANGYFVGLSGGLSTKSTSRFQIYTSAKGRQFVGQETEIRLAPCNDEWTLAVMIPKKDFDAKKHVSIRENLTIFFLLILSAVFGSMQMSRLYVKPILSGLSQVKRRALGEPTHIQEIDDLIEYLARQDTQEEAQAMKELEHAPAPFRLYDEFLQNIETLSPAERTVFDLYIEGHTAKEITEILCLSINTIKTHNKRIYMKLNVASRNELMVYVNMMKEMEGAADAKR